MYQFKWCVVMASLLACTSSCILSDKCIHFLKPGKRWEVTLTGKRTNPQNQTEEFVIAKGADCYDVEEHEILEEADGDDPEYQALRNELLVKAQADCVEKSEGFINVKCDPFDEELDLAWILQATPNVSCYLKNTYESNCPSPGSATEGGDVDDGVDAHNDRVDSHDHGIYSHNHGSNSHDHGWRGSLRGARALDVDLLFRHYMPGVAGPH